MPKRVGSQKDDRQNIRSNILQGVETLQSAYILDSLDDEMMVIDRDLRITQINSAVLQKHRGKGSSLIGKHCYEISHGLPEPCDPAVIECPVKKVLGSGQTERLSHVHRYNTGGKTEERFVDIIASPIRDSRGNIIKVVQLMRDSTEAKRLEERIIEANERLLALNTVASIVSQSMDLDVILNTALDKVLELMGGNVGGILLLDNESQTLSYRVYRGLSEEFVKGVAGLKLGEGIAGKVAEQGEPIYVDDISREPGRTRPIVIKEGLRAFASVPLQSKNQLLGVMNIASHSPRKFSNKDVQLLSSIANQIAVAIENAGLYREIQTKEEMRGGLLRQILLTQEEERKRIARELHDETSQALTGLAVNLEAVISTLPNDASRLKEKLRRIQSIAFNTLDGIHRAIYELRPSLLDDLGLVAAVNWHSENHLEAAGIKVRLETNGVERRLPIQVETALYRIIQEATTNILRHAGASHVGITLGFKESSVAIQIEDDGAGFTLEEVMTSADRERGLGLLSMRERAEFLGGWLTIRSRPRSGTNISAEIPVNEEVSIEEDTGIDS